MLLIPDLVLGIDAVFRIVPLGRLALEIATGDALVLLALPFLVPPLLLLLRRVEVHVFF